MPEITQIGNHGNLKTGKQSNDNDDDNDPSLSLLAFCEVAKSREEMFDHLGLKYHTDSYNKYIAPLIAEELIVMTLPDKPKSKHQQYVTTQKGKDLLNQKKSGQ